MKHIVESLGLGGFRVDLFYQWITIYIYIYVDYRIYNHPLARLEFSSKFEDSRGQTMAKAQLPNCELLLQNGFHGFLFLRMIFQIPNHVL